MGKSFGSCSHAGMLQPMGLHAVIAYSDNHLRHALSITCSLYMLYLLGAHTVCSGHGCLHSALYAHSHTVQTLNAATFGCRLIAIQLVAQVCYPLPLSCVHHSLASHCTLWIVLHHSHLGSCTLAEHRRKTKQSIKGEEACRHTSVQHNIPY